MASTGMIEKQRKRRFKRLLPGLLMEMDKLSALSGVKVCVIIRVPGDTRPTMWSSPVVTEQQLLDRLYSMHQTYDDCKPLSFSELRELDRLLCYHTEKLIASLEKKISQSEKVLPHNPPPSPMSYNGIDSGANIDGKVLKQQSLLDLTKQFDQLAIDSGANTNGQVSKQQSLLDRRKQFDQIVKDCGVNLDGKDQSQQSLCHLLRRLDKNGCDFDNMGSIMRFQPSANPSNSHMVLSQGNCGGLNRTGDSRMLCAGNSRALIGGNDSGSAAFPLGSFGGLIGGNGSGSGEFSPGSFGGRIGGNDSDSGAFPPGSFGGVNGEIDQSGMLSQANHASSSGEKHDI